MMFLLIDFISSRIGISLTSCGVPEEGNFSFLELSASANYQSSTDQIIIIKLFPSLILMSFYSILNIGKWDWTNRPSLLNNSGMNNFLGYAINAIQEISPSETVTFQGKLENHDKKSDQLAILKSKKSSLAEGKAVLMEDLKK